MLNGCWGDGAPSLRCRRPLCIGKSRCYADTVEPQFTNLIHSRSEEDHCTHVHGEDGGVSITQCGAVPGPWSVNRVAVVAPARGCRQKETSSALRASHSSTASRPEQSQGQQTWAVGRPWRDHFTGVNVRASAARVPGCHLPGGPSCKLGGSPVWPSNLTHTLRLSAWKCAE